jgi:glycosyltransferase 2 family protein
MKYIKILFIVLLVAVFLFLFLKGVKFGDVVDIIASINWLYPIVFLVGLFLQLFVRAYRWGLLLKPHKEKIPLLTMFSYTSIGFFLSTIIPGKVGEPAKGILLANEIGISRSIGLASVVLERLIDFLMMIVLLLVSLFFLDSSRSPLLMNLQKISYFVLPVILLFFVLFYLLNTDRVFGYVERLVRGLSKMVPARFREQAISFGLSFVKGLRLNLGVFDFLKLLVSSALVWLFLVPFYWYLMQAFEFGSFITVGESIPYFCIIVASATIPTPGMAGSFDVFSRKALMGLYSNTTPINEELAVAYTLLAHTLIWVIMILPGMISFWIKGVKFKTIRDIKERSEDEDVKNEASLETETAGT